MKSTSNSPAVCRIIGPKDGVGRIVVRAESYREFDLWISQRLRHLVARWAHRAAPGGGTSRRRPGVNGLPAVEREAADQKGIL
jgi:hypothetical protein